MPNARCGHCRARGPVLPQLMRRAATEPVRVVLLGRWGSHRGQDSLRRSVKLRQAVAWESVWPGGVAHRTYAQNAWAGRILKALGETLWQKQARRCEIGRRKLPPANVARAPSVSYSSFGVKPARRSVAKARPRRIAPDRSGNGTKKRPGRGGGALGRIRFEMFRGPQSWRPDGHGCSSGSGSFGLDIPPSRWPLSQAVEKLRARHRPSGRRCFQIRLRRKNADPAQRHFLLRWDGGRRAGSWWWGGRMRLRRLTESCVSPIRIRHSWVRTARLL